MKDETTEALFYKITEVYCKERKTTRLEPSPKWGSTIRPPMVSIDTIRPRCKTMFKQYKAMIKRHYSVEDEDISIKTILKEELSLSPIESRHPCPNFKMNPEIY